MCAGQDSVCAECGPVFELRCYWGGCGSCRRRGSVVPCAEETATVIVQGDWLAPFELAEHESSVGPRVAGGSRM